MKAMTHGVTSPGPLLTRSCVHANNKSPGLGVYKGVGRNATDAEDAPDAGRLLPMSYEKRCVRSKAPWLGSVACQRPLIQSIDSRLLRHLFSRWEPERPELLIRLRPRPKETPCVSR